MSKKVAELTRMLQPESEADWVSQLWDRYNNQRQGWIQEKKELRDFLFATSTETTSNNSLPWKNSTTLPKLTQIRDNLHSNYLSALFPNDSWLRWEGYSNDDNTKQKAEAIEAYMSNKTREGNFRSMNSRLLYDFIDYGNVFAMPIYEERFKEDRLGNKVPAYIGPNVLRISPLDIVFNPLAPSFDKTWKIVRSVKSIGELAELALAEPDNKAWADTVARRQEIRKSAGAYTREDFDKATGFSADGFGSMYEYLTGDSVEILEFYGDFFNSETGRLEKDQVITVIDRAFVARHEAIPGWLGGTPIHHVGWRLRPDNLWAMGPLDNLVGMQYRIDHLENLKADAQDLVVHPPLKIIGEVEQFVWGPGVEIHIDEQGDVVPLNANLNGVINAANEIQMLEARMEQYAGAPREAMGIRSPGEKTAFEVSQLQNAAGRIFQEKITMYETEFFEKLLNGMLEMARRNMETSEIVRVLDDELSVQSLLTVTQEDITASGVLRPIGARHFAAQAQLLQNLSGIFNGAIGQIIAPDVSRKSLTSLVEDVLGLERFGLFKTNVAVLENQETQQLAARAQEQAEVELETPTEEF